MNSENFAQISGVLCAVMLILAVTTRSSRKLIRVIIWVIAAIMLVAYVYLNNTDLFELIKTF